MRSLIEDRFSSLRFASLRIIQICLAAGVAWLIATRVVGHYEPFFAPISVVLVLGLAIEQRGRRAYEIAFGVALGIAIADLIVLALGTGTWQLMLVIGLAMSAAVLSGGGVMLVNQAAISGVLVATLPAPDLADTTHRFVDALVGGGVALAANAITPVDPVRLVRRYLEPLLARLSGTLVDIADALDHESHEEIVAALERARSLDPAVREMKIAVEAATGQRAQMDVFGTDYPTPDGSCIRDFIHVSDLAQVHRAALSYLRGSGGSVTLNCGYGHGYSVLETIEAVRRISGRNFAVQYAARRPGDIMTMVADTSRIRALLDWAPQFDNLDTIATHALAWEEKLLHERGNAAKQAQSA